MVDQPVYPASDLNPVRNSSGALKLAGIILNLIAAEQQGIISNGVKGFHVIRD